MDKELVALDSSEEQPDFYVKVEGTSDEIQSIQIYLMSFYKK